MFKFNIIRVEKIFFFLYLKEFAAVGLVHVTIVDIWGSCVPSRIGLAIVKVLGLKNLIDGFASANIVKGV